MKKFLTILFTGLILISFNKFAFAAAGTPNYVFDYECQRRTLLSQQGVDATGKPLCNLFCDEIKIYDLQGKRNDSFCVYGSKDNVVPGATLFGATYKVNEFFIPQEDAALIYLRSGLFVVMGLAGLLLILYGLYGWYVRSMSGGNPDKVQLSMSIFKNALIGGIMVVVAVVIVQLVYSFMGITQGAFDFNFIPKIGTTVTVNDSDVGRKCYSSQTDTNGHTCVEGKWK